MNLLVFSYGNVLVFLNMTKNMEYCILGTCVSKPVESKGIE